MSWISALFSSTATQPIEAIGNILDSLFTSTEEKLDKKIIMLRLAQKPNIAQIELNKIEAQHRSIFVSGWRPAVGWVCALALLYSFILRDIISWIMIINGVEHPPPPELAMEHLMTVLLSLLGLGGFRSVEKMAGRTK